MSVFVTGVSGSCDLNGGGCGLSGGGCGLGASGCGLRAVDLSTFVSSLPLLFQGGASGGAASKAVKTEDFDINIEEEARAHRVNLTQC